MIKFNVASINKCTEVEGPFKRLCIWFQGCNIHCIGCCNPDYQALIPKMLFSIDELVNIIKEAVIKSVRKIKSSCKFDCNAFERDLKIV